MNETERLILGGIKTIISQITPSGEGYPAPYEEIEKALAPNNKDFEFKDTLSSPKVKPQ